MIGFVVAARPDAAQAQALVRLAKGLGYAVVPVADADALRRDRRFGTGGQTLVLVPDLGAGTEAEAALRLAKEEPARAFVVLVAETVSPALYKALSRTGAGDWVGWDDCADELRDLGARLGGAGVTERHARIVSFLPSKGGVGNTLLALETGIHLAGRRKGAGRVAILDLNVQGGTLADALDLAPRFDIGEIVASPERLDEQLIDVFTSRHGERLDVFACPSRRIAFEAVSPAIVFTFLDAIARRYETILIDLPRTWIGWIDNLLQGSDVVIVSAEATVPGLRALSAALGHVDALDLARARLTVAVNLCDTDLLGRITRRTELERVLAGRSVHCIRRDAAAARAAVDTGRPLLDSAPNTRIGRDLRRLAEWCGAARDGADAGPAGRARAT